MGNPHAVIFVDEVSEETAPTCCAAWGKALENHPAFPERMNVHFVEVVDDDIGASVLHWERGSGPTLACGTGACAVCVAGLLTERTNATPITAHLPGGPLHLVWRESDAQIPGPVIMTGPATEVFTGDWPA